MTQLRFYTLLKVLIILLITAIIAPIHLVIAQDDATSELINLINALQASYGLVPYTVDPELMSLAQEHSDYQASIHTSTHQHSDGRVPPELGVVENVAGGDLGYVDPQIVVYQIWVDAGHMKTMIGYEAGSMRVGIANDGQALWAIALAHGVTIEQIRAWNKIPYDSNDIYAGQSLLIRPASLISPTQPIDAGQHERTAPKF